MGLLRSIVIAVLLISFFTFVALFGRLPALRRTPVGWLQRLLCLHAPKALRRVDSALTGGRVARRGQRLARYLFYEQNPVVLVIYLFLLTGSATLFLWTALPLLPTYLKIPILVILPAPYIFTYLCVTCNAHYITPTNHKDRMRDYPYDYILFRPGTICQTCNLVKPARSKHCGFCGVCVSKCDHHCPWVNNCLGRGNYHYFLALLTSLGSVQVYGAYLSWSILHPYFQTKPRPSIFSWARVQDLGNTVSIAVNRGGLSIAGVGFLAAATAALPIALLAYHIYLIWAGMTTNESQKWSDWKEDMAGGYVFKANRTDLRTHNRQRKSDGRTNGHVNPALDLLEDHDEIHQNWPASTDCVFVRTNDGMPPYGQETLWMRVWGLQEVVNIYDRGCSENFLEVLRGR